MASRESVAAVSRRCRSRAGLPEEVQALAPIFRAELQAYQGKYQDAYDLLAPVYEWFTEGFDSADLLDAKSLLNDLEG